MSDKVTRRQLAAARAREGIPVSLIIRKLGSHIAGRADLSPTQIRAAEILLKKSLPDLTAVEHSGEMTSRHVSELSREELERIAAGGSERTDPPAGRDEEPAGLH